MVFEPTGAEVGSLFGNSDALRLPINIVIGRRRPLTTKMWETLFREMEDAALATDLRLYELAMSNLAIREQNGFQSLVSQRGRFVVSSINRGSIEVTGAILLAAGWIFKKFIEPGWERSGSKKALDEAVTSMIDRSVLILKEQIDVRVVHKLKRLKIMRVSLRRPPNDRGYRLNENSLPDTELIYDKPKQVAHRPKGERPQ